MNDINFSKFSSSETKALWETFDAEEKKLCFRAVGSDERRTARTLTNEFERKRGKEERLREEFDKLSAYEDRLRQKGFCLIAGADESGRGALAGPLVGAAVILPEGFYLPGLKDCKLLSAERREEFYLRIIEKAVSWQTALIEPALIDRIGLQKANISALAEALNGLDPRPQYVLTDGFSVKELVSEPHLGLIKGDRVSISIAAASVISKVTRDKIMKTYHQQYPLYGFAEHKGYGTLEHRENLRKYGPCPIHRRSFSGVTGDMEEMTNV